MGVFYTTDMKLFLSLALTTLTAHQAASDWVGTGQVQCYGHVNVDVSTPPGGDYLDRGQVTCRPAEWVFESQLGPEAMFFEPQTGAEFEIGLGITMSPTSHGLSVTETSGTNRTTWVLAIACQTKATMDVVMLIVLVQSPVMDVKLNLKSSK